MHLADLHLGKRVNEFSMLEDQKYMLEQVLKLIEEEQVQGLLLAGDIYDRQIPPVEAVRLLDDFLTKVSQMGVDVYMIGGNHDSMERVSFGARLMEYSGIHIAAQYDGTVTCVTAQDGYGAVDIYLLPFIKPAQVRAVWGQEAEQIRFCQEAVEFVLGRITKNKENRNVLVAHQYVAGAEVCDSEERSVGGLDQVAASCFEGFDYVALGHLHGPQKVGRETVRYAGTLLKYSFSEVEHKKSVTIVELRDKGETIVYTRPVSPLHEMREIRGSYEEVTDRSHYINTDTKDYVRITLTDEEDIFDALGRLRAIYPNLMKLDYDNMRTRQNRAVTVSEERESKDPLTLAEELYVLQNNGPMSQEQCGYLQELIRSVWEEGEI